MKNGLARPQDLLRLEYKIYRSTLGSKSERQQQIKDAKEEPEFPGKLYKKRPLCRLSHDEMRSIIMDAVVEQLNYDDIARKHRVSKALVSSLVSRVKKNKDYLSEVLAKEK